MKKFTGLCIVASLTFFVAFGQTNQNVKATFVISTADIASIAVINRNMTKACVPTSELSILNLVMDADAEFLKVIASEKMDPLYSGRTAVKLCPCPPNYCPCDTMMVAMTKYVSLKTWKVSKFQLIRTKSKNMDPIALEEKAGEDGITEYKIPAKAEDGDYTVIIIGTFGGDPTPKTFELPASIKKGKIYRRNE